MKHKFSGFLPAALLLFLAMLSACTKQEHFGTEPSLPGCISLTYDEDNSSATSIAVYWDYRAALSQGAVSFTIQLVKKLDANAGNVYQAEQSKTFVASEVRSPGYTVFSGLSTNGHWYVRGRANYPGARMSEWSYLMREDDPSATAVIRVGTGIYDGPISTITKASGSLVKATSSTLSFSWSSTDYKDLDTDSQGTYSIALYKDAACTDLELSWIIKPGGNIKYTAANPPRFIFGGLDPDTPYWFKVTDMTEAEAILVSEPVEARTLPSQVVPLKTETASAGDIIMFEDFSELAWAGSYMDEENAAGYSSQQRSNAPSFLKATGENPVAGATVMSYYLVAIGQDIPMFNNLMTPLASTRLANWGWICEADAVARLCTQCGHLKLGTGSGCAEIVTAPLECLSGEATLEISFKAMPMMKADLRDYIVEIIRGATLSDSNHQVIVQDSGRIPVVQEQMEEGQTMKDYVVTVPGVKPGDRIAIGSNQYKRNGKYIRMLLDDLCIKVKSYE